MLAQLYSICAILYYILFSPFDWAIWGFGIWIAVRHWKFIRGNYSPIQKGKERDRLAYYAEFLPLFGLAGTVIGLFYTLHIIGNATPQDTTAAINASGGTIDPREVIKSFAPALSTTFSGMLWLIINLYLNAKLDKQIPKE
jgi:biopolymer transport protein ExbB/TolQ